MISFIHKSNIYKRFYFLYFYRLLPKHYLATFEITSTFYTVNSEKLIIILANVMKKCSNCVFFCLVCTALYI